MASCGFGSVLSHFFQASFFNICLTHNQISAKCLVLIKAWWGYYTGIMASKNVIHQDLWRNLLCYKNWFHLWHRALLSSPLCPGVHHHGGGGHMTQACLWQVPETLYFFLCRNLFTQEFLNLSFFFFFLTEHYWESLLIKVILSWYTVDL